MLFEQHKNNFLEGMKAVANKTADEVTEVTTYDGTEMKTEIRQIAMDYNHC